MQESHQATAASSRLHQRRRASDKRFFGAFWLRSRFICERFFFLRSVSAWQCFAWPGEMEKPCSRRVSLCAAGLYVSPCSRGCRAPLCSPLVPHLELRACHSPLAPLQPLQLLLSSPRRVSVSFLAASRQLVLCCCSRGTSSTSAAADRCDLRQLSTRTEMAEYSQVAYWNERYARSVGGEIGAHWHAIDRARSFTKQR